MPRSTRSATPADRVATVAAGLLLAVGLVACGGSDDAESGPTTSAATEESPTSSAPSSPATSPSAGEQESEAVTVTAVDFSFQVDEDSFTAGDVEFTLSNGGTAPHNLVVERDGQEVGSAPVVAPGQSAAVTVTLEPGEYVLYCGVGDHRAMGMEMTITVS